MKEKEIKKLLNEFNYNKNNLQDTLEFLLVICYQISKELKERK